MAKQNKNKKFTFNIIDALIILLFIALIALVIYVFILGKNLSELFTHQPQNTQETKTVEETKDEKADISVIDFEFDENVGYVLL